MYVFFLIYNIIYYRLFQAYNQNQDKRTKPFRLVRVKGNGTLYITNQSGLPKLEDRIFIKAQIDQQRPRVVQQGHLEIHSFSRPHRMWGIGKGKFSFTKKNLVPYDISILPISSSSTPTSTSSAPSLSSHASTSLTTTSMTKTSIPSIQSSSSSSTTTTTNNNSNNNNKKKTKMNENDDGFNIHLKEEVEEEEVNEKLPTSHRYFSY